MKPLDLTKRLSNENLEGFDEDVRATAPAAETFEEWWERWFCAELQRKPFTIIHLTKVRGEHRFRSERG